MSQWSIIWLAYFQQTWPPFCLPTDINLSLPSFLWVPWHVGEPLISWQVITSAGLEAALFWRQTDRHHFWPETQKANSWRWMPHHLRASSYLMLPNSAGQENSNQLMVNIISDILKVSRTQIITHARQCNIWMRPIVNLNNNLWQKIPEEWGPEADKLTLWMQLLCVCW